MAPNEPTKNRPLPPHLRPGAIDEQLAEAVRKGEFDDLPGKGQPLQGLNDDPLWWVKDKLKREQASFLPPALELRRDVEAALTEIRSARSEMRAREILVEINEKIRKTNATITSGPPSNLVTFDVESTIERWRSGEL
ncbi:MAG: DUF1992 domain-containing protein [Candidatus Eisenbacteria bacterium]|uniref:DUF1992 domain-containing protein n=1 Tax=Eiseniibacteriota bacterium TaxID=2212470 RepID=A0A956SFY1_UNCEI|nr:DUF1992 domain-containing protein [Candidatus Eisenbacteria bacterium]MCB9464549.1 DUF1992 domain-containing protein [Candidatus Eisenbacteria bacterium]